MPNWCQNYLTLEHEDPAMIARARKAFREGKFLEEFVPFPNGEWDYDWCVEHWGTKWDVGDSFYEDDEDPKYFDAGFDSAWAPPVAAYPVLESLGFKVKAMYFEGGCAFAGIYENGSDDYYEFSDATKEELQMLPEELEEAFGIVGWYHDE